MSEEVRGESAWGKMCVEVKSGELRCEELKWKEEKSEMEMQGRKSEIKIEEKKTLIRGVPRFSSIKGLIHMCRVSTFSTKIFSSAYLIRIQ